ncbi:hypothetical protein ACLBNB_22785 [Pseudomonas chlororaphis subsp. aurantiaca]|uniref:hypothetical protein n=1 Tax=Pseudomonas chlororaphis TaxID=587753 RepID=UPI000F57A034
MIVIAGNGTCVNGQVVNYLKSMLCDRRYNVLFVGTQIIGMQDAVTQLYGQKGRRAGS